MSEAAALAQKLGVDVSKVQEILAAGAAQAPSAGGEEFIGFARCITPGCELNDVDREIPYRVETVETKASDLPLVVSATQYQVPANDADLRGPPVHRPEPRVGVRGHGLGADRRLRQPRLHLVSSR
jgi:3-hydroxyisobutyrate dehydrogenase-like beta-hydroxyacid dehydrogenase